MLFYLFIFLKTLHPESSGSMYSNGDSKHDDDDDGDAYLYKNYLPGSSKILAWIFPCSLVTKQAQVLSFIHKIYHAYHP